MLWRVMGGVFLSCFMFCGDSWVVVGLVLVGTVGRRVGVGCCGVVVR